MITSGQAFHYWQQCQFTLEKKYKDVNRTPAGIESG
jgi:hypothetical protein